jgi:hypothetical protein
LCSSSYFFGGGPTLVGDPIKTAQGYSSSLQVQVSSRKKGGGSTDPFPGCTGCTSW